MQLYHKKKLRGILVISPLLFGVLLATVLIFRYRIIGYVQCCIIKTGKNFQIGNLFLTKPAHWLLSAKTESFGQNIKLYGFIPTNQKITAKSTLNFEVIRGLTSQGNINFLLMDENEIKKANNLIKKGSNNLIRSSKNTLPYIVFKSSNLKVLAIQDEMNGEKILFYAIPEIKVSIMFSKKSLVEELNFVKLSFDRSSK